MTDRLLSADREREDVADALRTALSVALHEHFDPECSGKPAYDETQAVAEAVADAVMRMPLVRAALSSPETTPAPDDWTILANDIRLVDGNHDLGAGELAARLSERGWTRAAIAEGPRAGWDDFEPDGDREELAYALMVAGIVVDVPGGAFLDLALAGRIIEALKSRDLGIVAALSSPETTPASVLPDELRHAIEALPEPLVWQDNVSRAAVLEIVDQRTPAGVLDEAWAAAEKALPEGWRISSLEQFGPESWQASAEPCPGCGGPFGEGDTPAAALLALAAALGRSGSG